MVSQPGKSCGESALLRSLMSEESRFKITSVNPFGYHDMTADRFLNIKTNFLLQALSLTSLQCHSTNRLIKSVLHILRSSVN